MEIELKDIIKKVDRKDTCAICLGKLRRRNIGILPCGHIFHWVCCEEMYQERNNNRCPICRRKIIDIESQTEEEEIRHCCFKSYDSMMNFLVKMIILLTILIFSYISFSNIYLSVTQDCSNTIIIGSCGIIVCVVFFFVIFSHKKIRKYAIFCNNK